MVEEKDFNLKFLKDYAICLHHDPDVRSLFGLYASFRGFEKIKPKRIVKIDFSASYNPITENYELKSYTHLSGQLPAYMTSVVFSKEGIKPYKRNIEALKRKVMYNLTYTMKVLPKNDTTVLLFDNE